MRIDDLKAFLAGRWHLTRRISDHRGWASGRFTGEAAFMPFGGGLRYDERGSLTMGGRRHPATRAYVYSFDTPRQAEVWFDGGGYFHSLDLGEGRWRVRHACADDLYEGAFRVHRGDAWTAVWRVSGPRKSYVIRTRYDRWNDE